MVPRRVRFRDGRLTWLFTLVFVFGVIPPAAAAILLEFGDADSLTPVSHFQFQPNQTRNIAVLVHNDGSETLRLSGYSLELGLGEGGPEVGGTLGPSFTAVDLVTSTLFESDHSTPTVNGGPNNFPGLGSTPQYLGLSLTTVSSAVAPETVGAIDFAPGRSLLGTLTISADGFTSPQTWDLEFVGAGSASFFNDGFNNTLSPTFAQSTLSVLSAVPEPRAYALVAGLGLLGFALWRKQRARTPALNRARRNEPTMLA